MRWLWMVVVFGLLGGCKRKLMTDDERKADYAQGIKPVLAKHQAPVTTTLAALESIPKAGEAEPRTTVVQKLPAPVTCTVDTCLIKTVGPTTALSVGSQPPLLNLKEIPRVLRAEYAQDVNWQSDENILEAVTALTHFAIVRVHTYDKPVPGTTADRYTGGSAAGDAIIYDVKTAKRVGAFTWTAAMPETMHIPADTKDPAAAYESEFIGYAQSQIKKALSSFYAGKGETAKPDADDGKLRERQIATLLVQDAQIVAIEVEITDSPACKVVVTAAKVQIAANPDTDDGVMKPNAVDIVRKVMGKDDCAVTYKAL